MAGIELPFLQLICCRSLWGGAGPPGHSGMRMDDYRAWKWRKGIISAYLHTRHPGFRALPAPRCSPGTQALAPRSGIRVAPWALAAQAGTTSRPRTLKVLDMREHRIVAHRDAAGGIGYRLQHDAFIEIVRPWAEGPAKRRNRLIGGGVACAVLLAAALNVAMLNRDGAKPKLVVGPRR